MVGDGTDSHASAAEERQPLPWPLLFDCTDACAHRVRSAECSCPVIESLHVLLDAIPDHLTLETSNHTVVWANAAALAGRDRTEVFGRPCHEVWQGSSTPCSPCPVEECCATRAPSSGSATTPDGRTWEIRAVPLNCADGRLLGVIKIARDVTRRVEAVKAEEALVRELAAKNAELENFAFAVAHDLKSPLIGILGFCRVIDRELSQGDSSRATRRLESISRAALQMSDLIEGLLELSRAGKQVGSFGEFSLSDVVRAAQRDLQTVLADSDARLALIEPLPRVRGDSLRVRQVFSNLFANAVKFARPETPPAIEVRAQGRGEEVLCTVKDLGIGVEPQYLTRMFEPLDRCGSQTEGSGLGLAICKRIVEAHGGRIWAESDGPGAGCAVCFTLPSALGRP